MLLLITLEKGARHLLPRIAHDYLFARQSASSCFLVCDLKDLAKISPDGLTVPTSELDAKLNLRAVRDRAEAMRLVCLALGWPEDAKPRTVGELEAERGK
jgi:hypothetical protein